MTAPVAYLGLITFSKLAGLRSFSEMTNFDLAATVAFGSMLATTIVNPEVSLLQGGVALAVLFTVQAAVAQARFRFRLQLLLENRPLLLMRDSRMLPKNLRKARMTENDLRSKLRLAGVTSVEHVSAAVLETTGDVSVLLENADGRPLDTDLLTSVAGAGAPSERGGG
ncbi:DUF421 domain-containing protein [Streptomonospora salina]|uniref:DUF421 domain-containing protein n=1 Tax=Streptomonospora salina TaxID=104205 RepID=UPI0035E76652